MISDLRLSQGFTMGKTQRHEPYDFATQMIPAVDPEALEDFSTYSRRNVKTRVKRRVC